MNACTALAGFLLLAMCATAAASDTPHGFAGAIEPCPRDASAFRRVQQRAQENVPEAQATLADCYEQGKNVEPDGKQAIYWLTLSAQQGFVPAEYELGRTYLYGRGIPADYAQALLWEEKAARAGRVHAQRDIALIYERGFGVTADPARAVFWNRKAAEQGDAQAQLHLANALNSGHGAPRDSREAAAWYLKAARQGLPEAALRYAEINEQKSPPVCAPALLWYENAARSGVTEAMYRLGTMHLAGKCGRASAESAYTWFQIGARHGCEMCRSAAGMLDSSLNAAQKARVGRAVDLWIQHNSAAAKAEDDEEREKR